MEQNSKSRVLVVQKGKVQAEEESTKKGTVLAAAASSYSIVILVWCREGKVLAKADSNKR